MKNLSILVFMIALASFSQEETVDDNSNNYQDEYEQMIQEEEKAYIKDLYEEEVRYLKRDKEFTDTED